MSPEQRSTIAAGIKRAEAMLRQRGWICLRLGQSTNPGMGARAAGDGPERLNQAPRELIAG
ncbi:MAG: hypothetical protein ACYDAG_11270 [Chloroflexota bacterium]